MNLEELLNKFKQTAKDKVLTPAENAIRRLSEGQIPTNELGAIAQAASGVIKEAGPGSDVPVGPQLTAAEINPPAIPVPALAEDYPESRPPASPDEKGIFDRVSDAYARQNMEQPPVQGERKLAAPPAPTPTTPEEAAAELAKGYQLGTKENLEETQGRGNLLRTLAGISDIGTDYMNLTKSAGDMFVSKPSDFKYQKTTGDNFRKMADKEEADLKEKIANQKNDPKSETSVTMRKMFADMGFAFGDNVSAADLEKMLPGATNMYTQQQAQEARSKELALDRQLRREEGALNRDAKLKAKGAKGGEGLKTLDRTFAKEYDELSSGALTSAVAEVKKLERVFNNMKRGKVKTGGLRGMLPDRMTPAELLSARADVHSTIMNSLRPILGAQFTEKEGQRVLAATWNEADSTENNMKRVERLYKNLEARAKEKQRKMDYFEDNDMSLAGFKYDRNLGDITPDQLIAEIEGKGSSKKEEPKSQQGTVKMISPDGKVKDVPLNMVDKAIAAGGRMAE